MARAGAREAADGRPGAGEVAEQATAERLQRGPGQGGGVRRGGEARDGALAGARGAGLGRRGRLARNITEYERCAAAAAAAAAASLLLLLLLRACCCCCY